MKGMEDATFLEEETFTGCSSREHSYKRAFKKGVLILSYTFISRVNDSLVRWFQLLSLWTQTYGVTIRLKPLQQYFHIMLFVFQYFTYWLLEFLPNIDFGHLFNSIERYMEQCSRINTHQLVYTAGGSVPKNFISYSTHEQKTIVHMSEERVNCRDKCFTLLSLWTKSYSMTRSTFSGFRDRRRMRAVRGNKKIGNSMYNTATTTTFCNIERFWMLTSA